MEQEEKLDGDLATNLSMEEGTVSEKVWKAWTVTLNSVQLMVTGLIMGSGASVAKPAREEKCSELGLVLNLKIVGDLARERPEKRNIATFRDARLTDNGLHSGPLASAVKPAGEEQSSGHGLVLDKEMEGESVMESLEMS